MNINELLNEIMEYKHPNLQFFSYRQQNMKENKVIIRNLNSFRVGNTIISDDNFLLFIALSTFSRNKRSKSSVVLSARSMKKNDFER